MVATMTSRIFLFAALFLNASIRSLAESLAARSYHTLSFNSPCWLLLDHTGEAGCKVANENGVVGSVHFITTRRDVDIYVEKHDVTSKSKCNVMYALVLNSELLNATVLDSVMGVLCTASVHVLHSLSDEVKNIEKFRETISSELNTPGHENAIGNETVSLASHEDKIAEESEYSLDVNAEVTGMYATDEDLPPIEPGERALVQSQSLNKRTKIQTHGFSPADKSPNARCGLYHNKPEKQVEWNVWGGGQERRSLHLPLTLVTDDNDIRLLEHVLTKERTPNLIPSIRSKTFMHAAEDATVCLRRGYCDPIGGWNVVGSLFPINDRNKTVVVSGNLDSTALFKDMAVGASGTVAGMAALLVASQALARLPAQSASTMGQNVLFTFYDGEAYDYIGSSRFATEVRDGLFPAWLNDTSFLMENIAKVIDIGQLGSRGNSHSPNPLFLHRDPTTESESSSQELAEILLRVGSGDGEYAQEQESTSAAPNKVRLAASTHMLPPSSLHSWLRWGNRHLPHVHVADHDSDSFANRNYHSFLDNAANFGVDDPRAIQNLCDAATIIARAIYISAGGSEKFSSEISPNCSVLEDIITSMTVSMNSTFIRNLMNGTECAVRGYPTDADARPLSLYASVSSRRPRCGSAAYIAYVWLLDSLPKSAVNTIADMKQCDAQGYMWIHGKCFNSPQTGIMRAVSPAFARDIESGKFAVVNSSFSTWTESQWSMGMPESVLFNSLPPWRDIINLGIAVATCVVSIIVGIRLTIYTESWFDTGTEILSGEEERSREISAHE
eukprot:CFRG7289T1